MCIQWFSKIGNGGYGFRARAKKEARPGMMAKAIDGRSLQRVCSSVVRAADLCEGRFPASPSSHGSGFHDPSAAGW
jgi:hypothetical protein